MPANKRIRPAIRFENDTELKWQIDVEESECRAPMRCVTHTRRAWSCRSGRSRYIAPVILPARGRLHDEPRPEAVRVCAACARRVEERAEQGNRAQNQRIGPDQLSRINRRSGWASRGVDDDLRCSAERTRPALFHLRGCEILSKVF